mmetsp:Transcript_8771/g.25010  ORF Transcript_8771/g.25010 Transcript_8771/m.25010 type:complete len:283 (+) Transcript_8771:393-1241(+)
MREDGELVRDDLPAVGALRLAELVQRLDGPDGLVFQVLHQRRVPSGLGDDSAVGHHLLLVRRPQPVELVGDGPDPVGQARHLGLDPPLLVGVAVGAPLGLVPAERAAQAHGLPQLPQGLLLVARVDVPVQPPQGRGVQSVEVRQPVLTPHGLLGLPGDARGLLDDVPHLTHPLVGEHLQVDQEPPFLLERHLPLRLRRARVIHDRLHRRPVQPPRARLLVVLNLRRPSPLYCVRAYGLVLAPRHRPRPRLPPRFLHHARHLQLRLVHVLRHDTKQKKQKQKK